METEKVFEGYKTCYIAFLDILGFKNIVDGKTCEEILEIYKKIERRPFSKIICNREDLVDTNSVQLKIMSDSICIYVEKTSKNALFALVETCALFQAHLIELREPILLRGAIVVGEIYASGDKTFGPGLSKAYLLEEKVAKYPRIIIASDLADEGIEQAEGYVAESLKMMLICDRDYFRIVNFLSISKKESIEKLKEYVDKKLSGTSKEAYDTSIRDKYLYLQRYVHSFIKDVIDEEYV